MGPVLCPPSWNSHSSLRGLSWVGAGRSLKTRVSCFSVYASDRSPGSGLKSHSRALRKPPWEAWEWPSLHQAPGSGGWRRSQLLAER